MQWILSALPERFWRSPEQNATNIARDKARWVARQNPGCYVLGADTMVVLDQEIIGQPADDEDTYRIISKLAGKQHRVITGVVLITPQGFAGEITGTIAADTRREANRGPVGSPPGGAESTTGTSRAE